MRRIEKYNFRINLHKNNKFVNLREIFILLPLIKAQCFIYYTITNYCTTMSLLLLVLNLV